nr:hypothetical protein [Tanacetum cinerariifolium]
PKEANHSAGTKANDDQNANSEEIDLHDEHFVLLVWSAYSTYEELEKLKRQEKESNDASRKEATHETQDVNTNNTNLLNVVSTPISAVGPSRALNNAEPSYLDDPSMPHLEDIYASLSKEIFTNSSYDDEVIFRRNKESIIRIFNIACFLSQVEPKKISQALEDESWVDAIQEELLQFKIQKEERIDYDEVFTPVARIEAIRIFLAFASYMGFIVYQMDVKSAFLYGTIDEEVYGTQPHGFVDPKFPNKVYKVVKALYGIHQAPRAWFMWMISFLAQQRSLCVKQKEDGIFISQDKYVAEIIKKFDFLIVKTASTPIETQKPLVKDEEAADVDVHLYRSMIGSLMYLTASRPDIIYLKGQPKLGLWYPKVSSFNLEAYSDSDYAGANLDRKSTTGVSSFNLEAYSDSDYAGVNLDRKSTTGAALLKGRLLEVTTAKHRLLLPSIVQEQTALGKDFSNPLMADNLPKIVWYILLSLVKNIEAGVPFYMFPRFVQLLVNHPLGDMSHHQDIYDNPSLTKKIFANIKRVGTGFSGVITPLFESMLVQATEEVGKAQDDVSIPIEPSTSKPHKKHKSKKQQPKAPTVPSPVPSPEHQLPSPSNDPIPDADKDSLTLQELVDLCIRLSNKVLDLESEVIDIKSSFTDKIKNLEDIVDQLEDENKDLKEKSFKTTQVDTATPVDTDEEEPAEVEEVLEVVKAAKVMTDVVTTALPITTAAQVPKVSTPKRRRGVIIQDIEETTTSLIVHSKVQSKDKGKGILIEEPKPLKGQA